jgi:predicted TIM-barrel fold metal-dependent hydrolase
MSIIDEPKIDCHNHILDPARFPYQPDTPYRPSGHEIAPAALFHRVLDAHGVHHALVVGTNSGYGEDSRCLLDALTTSGGRFKGIAVVPNDIGLEALAHLKAQGVVGIAYNLPFFPPGQYDGTDDLLAKLAELDMCLQVQVHETQLLDLLPLLERSRVRILIDHCGRPEPQAGLRQPAFQALLALSRTGRVSVKLSGYSKISRQSYPYEDMWPYVHALVDAFTLDHCVWASDWPFIRAPERVDYMLLLLLIEQLFPDPAERRKLLWDTPSRLFGFGGEVSCDVRGRLR